MTRPRRAIFVSSSIGLGHVQRDLAVARALRALVPDLEIDWWAQHPATVALEAAGERLHPKSHLQALESAHWEEEASQHELHAFDVFRRMDEILVANFMLFHEVVQETPYDLWIGDESWEVDYYLHENPELKAAPYVFLTDVIGFLPVDPHGNPREAALCADYNAEMIKQRARYPWLRDLSLYVGEYEELPDVPFGPGLPSIRDWARDWFAPVGYILPFDPSAYLERLALRTRLGYGTGYPLLFASAGGTSVGRDLLRRIVDGYALFTEAHPDARLVVVAGPRIRPEDLPDVPGLERRAYVHNLFEHLASADAAIVQGGLSTTMELVATRRPFAYVPLRKHWEQQHHVSYRLSHYGATNRLEYADLTPARVAETMQRLVGAPTDYREVPPEGARRAAAQIASLLSGGPRSASRPRGCGASGDRRDVHKPLMRVRHPDYEGYVERGGVRTFYEVHGSGAPIVVFLPAWAICYSRIWKAQVPYFARHYRVVTFDPRGNGRSDRPLSPSAYLDKEYVDDALAVMDATHTERAVMVGLSTGGWLAALLAARYPDRVLAAVMAGSRAPLGQPLRERTVYSFEDRLETEEGWAKHNRHYWHKDYRGYLEFFFSKVFSEPHSTKQREDGVAWGLETTPEILAATVGGRDLLAHFTERPDEAAAVYRSIRCPLLVIHGDQDQIVSYAHGAAISEATGAPLVTIAGGGHNSFGRDPVKLNLLLRTFIDRACPLDLK